MQSNDICVYCKNQDTGYCMDCNVPVFDENEFAGIDVVPVVHGKWLDNNDDFYPSACHCSICGMDALTKEETDYDYVKSNYCPHCGARMDGEKE